MSKTYGLHWFRRDLRIPGNEILQKNQERHHGRTLGIFFFDSTFLARPDFSHRRFAFFLDSLCSLKEEFKKCGGDLLFLDAVPQVGFPKLLKFLKGTPQGLPALVTFNRDYEPFARKRDDETSEIFQKDFGLPVESGRDHLLMEPEEIQKGECGFYQVYSPFARKWFDRLDSKEVHARIENQSAPAKAAGIWPLQMRWAELLGNAPEFQDQLTKVKTINAKNVDIPIPAAGHPAGITQLKLFKEKLDNYGHDRDYPAVSGTSKLSIFLKNGSLTTAQVIGALELKNLGFKDESGRTRFLKELVWREFYYHILFHCPRVENEAYLQKYKSIPWENDPGLFAAWQEGRTGYAIVDAGMRELKQTGWMHNRVRMIVASFLTKDLLIDWRWGERHFMHQLLDGDLAPNNGGWQWAASTGCDPQPYFRIFNPTLQSLRFDPEGHYIKRFVPERAHLKGKALHEPMSPIVDHAHQKLKALRLYKNA